MKGHFVIPDLKRGKFLRKIGRFLCEVEVNGRVFIAHIPDPSPLKSLFQEKRPLLLSRSDGKRKSVFTVYGVFTERGIVGVNSLLPNRLIKNAIAKGNLFGRKPKKLISEFPFEGKRFDFFIEMDQKNILIEVKSVSLVRNKSAFFPHSPTKRGTEHVQIMEKVSNRFNPVLIFVAQCDFVNEIRIAKEIDQPFFTAVKKAVKHGVNLKGFTLSWTPPSIFLHREVPVIVE